VARVLMVFGPLLAGRREAVVTERRRGREFVEAVQQT